MKQKCFDPRDPDYDGPDDDETDEPYDGDYEEPDDYGFDNPADDFIMTDRELRGEL